MAWYYNSTRIYVYDYEAVGKQIIARLQPLDSGTVLQIFGNENRIFKLQCKVVGGSGMNNLLSALDDGLAYKLEGPSVDTNMYLASLTYKRDIEPYQTIDKSQDCTTQVYTVTMELYI